MSPCISLTTSFVPSGRCHVARTPSASSFVTQFRRLCLIIKLASMTNAGGRTSVTYNRPFSSHKFSFSFQSAVNDFSFQPVRTTLSLVAPLTERYQLVLTWTDCMGRFKLQRGSKGPSPIKSLPPLAPNAMSNVRIA